MVNITTTQEPPLQGWSSLLFYDGSNNLIYVCKALSTQPAYTFSVAAGTLTNVVVSAGVATVTTTANHGLQVGNLVTGSGSATSALNAAVTIASVPSTTTFTFSTSAANGTYTDVLLTTTAPRSSTPVWSIQKNTYSGSNLSLVQFAYGSPVANQVADNRTSLAYA